MESLDHIKIFLSSTFIDLSDIRAEISKWLSGIFGAQLIIMETFGSDAAPPDISSIRRVRECDFFVGIYASRYGTLDKATGKSITELELDEANNAHSSGVLSDIMLYLIAEEAEWPEELKERNKVALAGLEHLREKSKQHTTTPFRTKEELLFCIVRDIYTRLTSRLSTPPLKVRELAIPSRKSIRQPLGMEFFTSEYREYLVGRENETNDLLLRLANDSIILLLGDSGVGKTSIIHAGIIPKAADNGWRTIYTRPFGLPHTDIIRQVLTSIYEGRPTYKGTLVPLLAEIIAALEGIKVLLIIDQFEDILIARNEMEKDLVISDLQKLRELSSASLHILISYRADLEGRLGVLWQRISGSPLGLPRVYLSGISADQAWAGIQKTINDLAVTIKLTAPELTRIKRDLLLSSKSLGFQNVYPPYIQMLIDHIWTAAKKDRRIYQFKHYQAARGMEGVIGGYLNRQLAYAQDSKGHSRAVLTALVRSYGVKAQRSLDEIVADTGLDTFECELALKKLIDLRLVRHIDPHYEVTHDFIARKIMAELVDSEEREYKRLRELLSSKGAAYQTTGAILTSEELLLLYKHKERIVPTDSELRILLTSWLKGIGPALFWILQADPGRILEWLTTEESKKELERDEKVAIILLRHKLNAKPLSSDDYFVFRGYQLSSEMAALILENPLSIPKDILLYGLRHLRHDVKEACKEAIAYQVKYGDLSWIDRLRRSTSFSYRRAYIALVLKQDVQIAKALPAESKVLDEFIMLKSIVLSHSPDKVRPLLKSFRKLRPPIWLEQFGTALTYMREHRCQSLMKFAQRVAGDRVEIILSVIDSKSSPDEFDFLLSTYVEWNSKEKDQSNKVYWQCNALAQAIFRAMDAMYMPRIRKIMKSLRLTQSSREIMRAVLKYGTLKDFKFLLNRIAKEEREISLLNHTELGITIARRLAEITKEMPTFLRNIGGKKEFWEYIHSEDRHKLKKTELLPIKNVANRRLYIRLAAYGMIGSAKLIDQDFLVRLSTHNYRLIARTAAIKLVRLSGDSAVRKLSLVAEDVIRSGDSEILAESLRYAEVDLYGVAKLL
jgi:hypothetical protein